MYMLQILTLFISLVSSMSQKFDIFRQAKCCYGSLIPLFHQQQPWMDTLREATYQSIIRHLDFTGTLDGRLDRDHALWRHLQEAKYFVDDSSSLGNRAEEIKIGALVEKPQDNHKSSFEFHQTDKSVFECSRNKCYSKNSPLLALWKVRRSEHPYALWIQVKLPKIDQSPTEDVYEYNVEHGLRQLNPDPSQYNSFKSQKRHRFLIPQKKKSEFKSIKRLDFHFPGPNKGFAIGSITPTSFINDSPSLSGINKDRWIISSPRKPHPGVIVETGLRNPNQNSPFDPLSRPFIASGAQGFHHIIHSLPSTTPPQHLDHPSQDLRGFLPSVGPISAPSPYKTEYAYDPRYVVYYKNLPPVPPLYTTPVPKYFKPSTEFMRYSEVDPFYHPKGEFDLLHTSPMPNHNFPTTTFFPNSNNEQLLTNSPMDNINPPFKIIVGDVNPVHTTQISRPVNKVLSTTEIPRMTELTQTEIPRTRLLPKPQTKSTKKPNSEEIEEITTKAFGEKIKPKTSTTRRENITTVTKPNFTTKSLADFNYDVKIHTLNNEKEEKATSIMEPENYTQPPENLKGTIYQNQQIIKNTFNNKIINSTQSMEISEITEMFTETTTEESERKTTYSEFEMSTQNADDEEKIDEHFGRINEDTKENFQTTLKRTKITVLGHDPTESENFKKNTSHIETGKSKTDSTMDDYYNTDETTEVNNQTTINSNLQNSDDNDFFSTLTDSLLSTETTTTTNDEMSTLISKEKPPPQDIDAETQESKLQNIQYRLLTFPGDPVSIVANRISKTVSFRTAAGKEGKLQNKQPIVNRYRFSDAYKDYSTIL